jgi:hypothetical protein
VNILGWTWENRFLTERREHLEERVRAERIEAALVAETAKLRVLAEGYEKGVNRLRKERDDARIALAKELEAYNNLLLKADIFRANLEVAKEEIERLKKLALRSGPKRKPAAKPKTPARAQEAKEKLLRLVDDERMAHAIEIEQLRARTAELENENFRMRESLENIAAEELAWPEPK